MAARKSEGKSLDNMNFSLSNRLGQFKINVTANVIAYVISLLVGLWFAPYIISNVGIEAYGLYPLATSLSNYLNLITLGLNGAVGRFLAIDLNRNSFEDANITFNTALIGSLLIAIGGIPLIIGFAFAVPFLFSIPLGQETATQLLFFFVMVSFFITTISSNFALSTWIKSRFDLRSVVNIISIIIRLLVVILIFEIGKPNIWIVGLGVFIASIFSLIGNVFLWKKLTPELTIAKYYFDKTRINKLFSMGSWMVVNEIGALLFQNTSLIIANISLGAKIGGEYGTIILFSSLLRGFTSAVSSVFTPMILEKYADYNINSIQSLSNQAVRLIGIIIAIPVGLICGFGKPILELWLGNNFAHLWLLLVLTLLPLPINLSVTPLFSIQTVLNKVKIPGIVSLILGVVNIGLAILFINTMDWGAYGIAIAGAIVLTIKNFVFTPVYSASIQGLPWYTFIKAAIPGAIASFAFAIISTGLSLVLHISSWIGLIVIGGSICLVYIVIIYFFVLTEEEKLLVRSFLPKFI